MSDERRRQQGQKQSHCEDWITDTLWENDEGGFLRMVQEGGEGERTSFTTQPGK